MASDIDSTTPDVIKEGDSKRFLLRPKDNDLFVRTGEEIIASCRLGISVELWLQELASMHEHVRDWCHQHHDRVRRCYLTGRDGRVVLFFVPSCERFDFDLADELTGLLNVYSYPAAPGTGSAASRNLPSSSCSASTVRSSSRRSEGRDG